MRVASDGGRGSVGGAFDEEEQNRRPRRRCGGWGSLLVGESHDVGAWFDGKVTVLVGCLYIPSKRFLNMCKV